MLFQQPGSGNISLPNCRLLVHFSYHIARGDEPSVHLICFSVQSGESFGLPRWQGRTYLHRRQDLHFSCLAVMEGPIAKIGKRDTFHGSVRRAGVGCGLSTHMIPYSLCCRWPYSAVSRPATDGRCSTVKKPTGIRVMISRGIRPRDILAVSERSRDVQVGS